MGLEDNPTYCGQRPPMALDPLSLLRPSDSLSPTNIVWKNATPKHQISYLPPQRGEGGASVKRGHSGIKKIAFNARLKIISSFSPFHKTDDILVILFNFHSASENERKRKGKAESRGG